MIAGLHFGLGSTVPCRSGDSLDQRFDRALPRRRGQSAGDHQGGTWHLKVGVACEEGRIEPGTAKSLKKGARAESPGALPSSQVKRLEVELRTKLQGARIVGGGHLSEVRVRGVLSMLLNCVWLKTLKDSNRSSRLGTLALNGMVLNRDQLKLKSPGPTTTSFPALPKPWFGPPFQGAIGFAKELVLNHAADFFG